MRAEKSLPPTPVDFRSHSLTLLSPETGLRKASIAITLGVRVAHPKKNSDFRTE